MPHTCMRMGVYLTGAKIELQKLKFVPSSLCGLCGVVVGQPQVLGEMVVLDEPEAWENAWLPLATPRKLSSDSGKEDHHLTACWLMWPDHPSIK